MLRYPLSLLSPAGVNSRLSVLIFHRVHRAVDPLFPGEPTAEWFDRLLGHLKRWFNVLPLPAAVAGLSAGTLPSRPLCITFDDGYVDNYELALPILQKHGLSATFFIATGYLDGGCMFNDRVIEAVRACASETLDLSSLGLGVLTVDSVENKRRAIDRLLPAVKYTPSPDRERIASSICHLAGIEVPTHLMMRAEQVKAMQRAGMEIGGHTRDHPILARADAASALRQMIDGKDELERIVEAPVRLFAYPNGKPGVDYLAAHVDMVREAGFVGAVSTAKGVAMHGADVFQIPRFTPWDAGMLRFGGRLGSNLLCRNYDRA